MVHLLRFPIRMNTKSQTYLLLLQSIYISATALWGLFDINSFMHVTGPKTDIWLVKTVSALLLCIALCFFFSILRKQISLNILSLAISNALVFTCIDFYYVITGTISSVYLLDAILQLTIISSWIYILTKKSAIEK